ncbi:Ig-like domain-containing protein [Microbacterium sp. GCS4]|uniref:Ig-like domain-containing protein n=1 Tax=Microbacterium sp. GCS4 TaxID=1692239 RepID=UPI00067FA65A|nr:Ig-like domain-containing protein [Microbacterium sp. GCS4]KNY05392.1 hypothetical protein AKH00_13685 [Microbacterium sp. GCS4]
MVRTGWGRRFGAAGAAVALVATGIVVLDDDSSAVAAVYAQCQNQDSLDWASLPDRSSPTTVTGDGVTYALTRDDQAPVTGSPAPPQVDYATVKTAVQGNRSGYYSLAMDPRNLTDHEELILTPDNPVAGFELTLLDVDIRTDGGNYRDVAVVSASLRGTAVTATPSALGSAVQYSTRADGAAVVTGIASADNTSENANATLAFPSPVDRIVIRYETGAPPLGGNNPTQQLIGIDDFRWCGLSTGVAKSVSAATFDSGHYTVNYDYTLENNGGPGGFDPQIVEDLAARFGTYVSGTPTARGTYTVGATTIVTNSVIPVSASAGFTGSGTSKGILTPGVGALGSGEKIVVRVPVTFVPAALPFSVTNQVTGTLDYFAHDNGTVEGDQTDRSTNGSNPDADGDGHADDDGATTPLTIQGTPVIDLTVTDDAGGRAREGESVSFTYTAVNRGDVPLTGVTIDGATPALVCTPAQPAAVPVGGRLVCTGTRVVGAPDVARGVLVESPTVTAQSTVGSARDADTDTVPVVPNPVAQPDTGNGAQGQPQRIDPLANDTPGAAEVPLDPATLRLLDADGQPTERRVVAGEGAYEIDRADPQRPVVVFTPEPGFAGTATPIPYRVADGDGIIARSTITPAVTPQAPTAARDETSGPQGIAQRIRPLDNDTAGHPSVPIDPTTFTLLDAAGSPAASVTVPGQGVYTVESGPQGPTVVFTPQPDFVGAAVPVSYRIADSRGATATSTYAPTLTAVTPVATADTGEARQGAPARIPLLANDRPGDPAVPLVPVTTTLLTPEGVPADTVTVPGEGVYTLENGPDGPTAVFTPEPRFAGTPTPVVYRVADANGTTVTATVTPRIVAVTPTASPDTTTGMQGQQQRIDVTTNDTPGDPGVPLDPASVTLLQNGEPVREIVTAGVGTYSLGPSGTIIFTPEAAFSGPAPAVAYRIADANGTTAESTYTPTVTAVVPVANPDQTTGRQGAVQQIDVSLNDAAGDASAPLVPASVQLLNANREPVAEVVVDGVGTYSRGAGGVIVFTPLPAFTGDAPGVPYRIADANGTTAESTYTPTVTPVTPTANPDATTGPQGQAQQIDVSTNDAAGDPAVPLDPASVQLLNAAGEPVAEVVVDGAGTYTRGTGGVIVFTPLPDFVGTATPVPYRIADANGTFARSTYTPTVTPAPGVPVAAPDATTGPQNQPQRIDVSLNDTPGDPAVPLNPASVQLLNAAGEPVTEVVVDGAGTYTRGAGGVIVFTPLPEFTGTAAAVPYRIADADGVTAESTYTPTVTPVVPTASPDATTGPQGRAQQIDVSTNDAPGAPDVPLDPASVQLLNAAGEPVAQVVVDGAGTYTRGAGGVIVFTPLPEFTGTATAVPYRIADANGTFARSTYTPTVTPVVPTASPDETSGPQGQAQQIDVSANDTPGAEDVPLDPATVQLLNAAGEPVAQVVVDGAGTYTRGAGGVIVFTPLPEFVGTATAVPYRIADANGTFARSTYTPTVTPEPGRPAALPDTSTGPQGRAQQIDVSLNDTPGDPAVPLDPASVELLDAAGNPTTEVVVDGAGTYTRGAGGVIVFTPLPAFTGTAPGVPYRIADADGVTAQSTYTPTVTPVVPTASPDATSGPQGQVQQIDVSGNDTPGADDVPLDPASVQLLNAAGEPVAQVVVDGAGTYTRGAGGIIVFTPLPEFVGTATAVPYRIADANGTFARSTYTPTVTPEPGRPAALPDTSTGLQGAAQQVDPLRNDTPGSPDSPLDPATTTLIDDDGDPVGTVAVPGVGEYTIERPSGESRIVFTPDPSFSGTVPAVTYRVSDSEGVTAQSTYTPTVTAVTPIATPDTTTGVQGEPQQVDVSANDTAGHPSVPLTSSSVTLLNADGQVVPQLVVDGIGAYSRGSGGAVVFTPEPDFVGAAPPIRYRIADANGTTVETTYTPTVTPTPRPAASPDTSSGRPGEPQSIDPLSNDRAGSPAVPLDPSTLVLLQQDDTPTARMEVPGVGVFIAIAEPDSARLQFLPEPDFIGTTPEVRYRIADVDGETTISTYQAVVSAEDPTTPPVTTPPAPPAPKGDVRSGPLGALAATGGGAGPIGLGSALLLGGILLTLWSRRRHVSRGTDS